MRKFLYWIIVLILSIELKGQSNSNQLVFDTLVVYKHYGIIMCIDTVNDDTTFIGDNIRSNEGFISDAIAQAYKAEYNVSSQLGSWVHGIKVEMTRTANIQPASSGWFGGQFVLNSGTSAWDDINKPSYAIQGVIKGDQWDGIQDVNAGRFELQSSGSVKDIVYILANTGTTVSSSMLYMPTHVNVPNMIQFNAQSSATVTNGIDFVSGGGGSFNYGIDFSGATINTADIKFSDGTTLSSGSHFEDDVIIDSSLTIDDSIKIKMLADTAIIEALGGNYLDLSDWTLLLQAGPAYLDSLLPATNDSSSSSIGTVTNPYGGIYTSGGWIAKDSLYIGDRSGNSDIIIDAANASNAVISLMRNGVIRAQLYASGVSGQVGFNADATYGFRFGFVGNANEYIDLDYLSSGKVGLIAGKSSVTGIGNKFFIRGGTTTNYAAGDLYLAPGYATATSNWANLKILSADYGDTIYSIYSNSGHEYSRFYAPFTLPLCYHLNGDSIVTELGDTIATPPIGMMIVDTSDGDTLKVYLNSAWEVK